jgi:hypothetical protein
VPSLSSHPSVPFSPQIGGVNHCTLHCCRLARFRGLMIRGKYGAVIGRKMRVLYASSVNFQVIDTFKPITAPYFPLIIKPRNVAKRQRKLQWLTPPTSLTASLLPMTLYLHPILFTLVS